MFSSYKGLLTCFICDCNVGPKEFTALFYSLQHWRVSKKFQIIIDIKNTFLFYFILFLFLFKFKFVFLTTTLLQTPPDIFERFDRYRSGRIDSTELREALLSLGFAVLSPVVCWHVIITIELPEALLSVVVYVFF